MCQQHEKILSAYGEWVVQLIAEGWTAYLLTFQFDRLSGSEAVMCEMMRKELERVFATSITRILSNPKARSSRTRGPIWIACFDYPVPKRKKKEESRQDTSINNGLHVHAIALIPPRSRLKVGLERHFEELQSLYVRGGYPLSKLNAKPIVTTPERATDYVLKSIPRGRFGLDDMMVLR